MAGYATFSEFILALYAIDKEAARFIGKICIAKDRGQVVPVHWNTFYRLSSPIKEWRRGDRLTHLFAWSSDGRHDGMRYWSRISDKMKEARENVN